MIANYCQTLMSSTLAPFSKETFQSVLGTFGGATGLGPGWSGILLVGVLAAALMLALTYMASKFLQTPKLEAWSRFELFQLVATLVIALLIAGWIWGMCSWDMSIFDAFNAGDATHPAHLMYSGAAKADLLSSCNDMIGSPIPAPDPNDKTKTNDIVTPYCAAQGYLEKMKTRGDDVFQTLLAVNVVFSYTTQIRWESRPLGIGYTLEPLAGFQQLQNVFFVTLSGFLVSYLSVLVQMRILDFFLLAMPWFFLPLGLLMRALPPTRQFGGAVVGFALASLFFYPLILVFNDLVVFSYMDDYIAKHAVTAADIQRTQDLNDNTRIASGWQAQDFSDTAKFRTYDDKPGKVVGQDGTAFNIMQIVAQSHDQLVFKDENGNIVVFTNEDSTLTGGKVWNTYRIVPMFDPMKTGEEINANMGKTQTDPATGKTADNPVPASTRIIEFFSEPGTDSPFPARTITMSDRSGTLSRTIWFPFRMVMIYFLAAVVLPVVNLMIYIEIARVLTKFLGAEMDLTNLTRLI